MEETTKLDENQSKFIDYYLETMDPAGSARRAGYDKVNAQKIGLELLGQEIIQKAIEKRREELNIAFNGMKFSKDDVIRIYWGMYAECRNKGKLNEAKQIINDIARWYGVEPDAIKSEIANLVFNIDGNKI